MKFYWVISDFRDLYYLAFGYRRKLHLAQIRASGRVRTIWRGAKINSKEGYFFLISKTPPQEGSKHLIWISREELLSLSSEISLSGYLRLKTEAHLFQ